MGPEPSSVGGAPDHAARQIGEVRGNGVGCRDGGQCSLRAAGSVPALSTDPRRSRSTAATAGRGALLLQTPRRR